LVEDRISHREIPSDKIYTATLYPIRFDGELYLLMVLNTGEKILRHPIKAEKIEEVEKKKIVLTVPKLKTKKIAGLG
jgi:hypothetical protein